MGSSVKKFNGVRVPPPNAGLNVPKEAVFVKTGENESNGIIIGYYFIPFLSSSTLPELLVRKEELDEVK